MSIAAISNQTATKRAQTPSFGQTVVDYLKEGKGMEAACKVVSYSNFWLNLSSAQTGYKPSAEYNSAGHAASVSKNLMSALTLPGGLYDVANKVSKYREIDASASVEESVNKSEAAKSVVQGTLGLTSAPYDFSDFWDKAVGKISHVTKDLFGKIHFTVLSIFMAWKTKDEVACVQTNWDQSNKSANLDNDKSETLWQWVKLGMVNTAKHVCYLALGILKMLSHFGGYPIPAWGYVACISAGLILGVGSHFYGKMNGLDKNPALAVHHQQAVAAAQKEKDAEAKKA
jgi:hypothetical protein